MASHRREAEDLDKLYYVDPAVDPPRPLVWVVRASAALLVTMGAAALMAKIVGVDRKLFVPLAGASMGLAIGIGAFGTTAIIVTIAEAMLRDRHLGKREARRGRQAR